MRGLRSGLVAAALWCAAVAPGLAAELVFVEYDRCASCIRFNKTVGQEYAATTQGQKAPLKRVRLRRGQIIPDAVFTLKVRATPTFVLLHKGREVGRIVGFSSPRSFYARLDPLLARLN